MAPTIGLALDIELVGQCRDDIQPTAVLGHDVARQFGDVGNPGPRSRTCSTFPISSPKTSSAVKRSSVSDVTSRRSAVNAVRAQLRCELDRPRRIPSATRRAPDSRARRGTANVRRRRPRTATSSRARDCSLSMACSQRLRDVVGLNDTRVLQRLSDTPFAADRVRLDQTIGVQYQDRIFDELAPLRRLLASGTDAKDGALVGEFLNRHHRACAAAGWRCSNSRALSRHSAVRLARLLARAKSSVENARGDSALSMTIAPSIRPRAINGTAMSERRLKAPGCTPLGN